MTFPISVSQATLAGAILGSTIGTYIAVSPPNPSSSSIPATGDSIRRFFLAGRYTSEVAVAPLAFLSLYTSSLALLHPKIPSAVFRYGVQNGLNTKLITWSSSTSIPLALILCAGIPLRLVSYSSLGKNFTFTLMEPDRLTTTGIYGYVQHPSYTGLVIIILCNVALLCREDGALGCLIPPRWHRALRSLWWTLFSLGLSVCLMGIWTRVSEEESLLRAEFGVEWEDWHAKTSRFIPWLL